MKIIQNYLCKSIFLLCQSNICTKAINGYNLKLNVIYMIHKNKTNSNPKNGIKVNLIGLADGKKGFYKQRPE